MKNFNSDFLATEESSIMRKKLDSERTLSPIHVFVHLAYDKDPLVWKRAWAAGTLVGRNEDTPYGYGRATQLGCKVVFSRSAPENIFNKILRLSIRVIVGFDLLHAWNNRHAMLKADVIWTHTESQFLAVAAVLMRRGTKPKLIGQAVWLFDRWPKLSFFHKLFFRMLINQVDVITTHSPLNAEIARSVFPNIRVEIVQFGVPSENARVPKMRPTMPLKIVAVGNDRHRDWDTLFKSLGGQKDIIVKVLSGTAPQPLSKYKSNIFIKSAKTNAELDNAYEEATIAIVPLVKNFHASGITVIQEAVLAGIPVVASDTGGLRHYFTEEEITFYPVGDAMALRRAVYEISMNFPYYLQKASRAQLKFLNNDLGADSFINDHVILSREILVSH